MLNSYAVFCGFNRKQQQLRYLVVNNYGFNYNY